jgi:predicted AlkP superfamily pyrophosphatase or phosphodiesterase
MLKNIFLALCSLWLTIFSFSQSQHKGGIARPKLVIGLVVDQMRWDYLYRYYDLYSANGFKRLLNEGFSCENTLIPYLPTYTAPGHACIYTGSVPAIHGIVGNNWFERSINKTIYCTDDSAASTIGSNSTAGKMSPANLWTTTITDELRLSNNFKSKVIGIALKDRAAILPAGHNANAAYWFDIKEGKWISSSYYMAQLPDWLNKFNEKHLPDIYMSKDWNTLLPLSKYDLSTADNKEYEHSITGETSVTFPHKLSQISKQKYLAFEYTPFGNTYTFDLAKSAIENEKLGNNNVTDFLTISLSSTDYIGHSFGPNSIEVEDTYLRLDNDITEFLQFLDAKLGKGNYLLFLSADHGVAHIPGFLQEHNIPAGLFNQSTLTKEINQLLEKKFSFKNGVLNIQNYQVYLNTDEIEKRGKILPEIKQAVIDYLQQQSFIINAFETEKISVVSIPEPIKKMLINGYNPKRSGDIHFILKAGYFDGTITGTTHGSWNPYDAHIPLVWFGWNIKHGTTNRETYMTDIAPTIAAMLKIQMPSGSVGKVIEEVTGF